MKIKLSQKEELVWQTAQKIYKQSVPNPSRLGLFYKEERKSIFGRTDGRINLSMTSRESQWSISVYSGFVSEVVEKFDPQTALCFILGIVYHEHGHSQNVVHEQSGLMFPQVRLADFKTSSGALSSLIALLDDFNRRHPKQPPIDTAKIAKSVAHF
jgi:hypothetical protein